MKKRWQNKESRRNLHSTKQKTTSSCWLEIVLNIKCNFHSIKMEFQKIVNLLDTASDDKDLPRFVTKKWTEVFMINQKEITMPTKKLELKR